MINEEKKENGRDVNLETILNVTAGLPCTNMDEIAEVLALEAYMEGRKPRSKFEYLSYLRCGMDLLRSKILYQHPELIGIFYLDPNLKRDDFYSQFQEKNMCKPLSASEKERIEKFIAEQKEKFGDKLSFVPIEEAKRNTNKEVEFDTATVAGLLIGRIVTSYMETCDVLSYLIDSRYGAGGTELYYHGNDAKNHILYSHPELYDIEKIRFRFRSDPDLETLKKLVDEIRKDYGEKISLKPIGDYKDGHREERKSIFLCHY